MGATRGEPLVNVMPIIPLSAIFLDQKAPMPKWLDAEICIKIKDEEEQEKVIIDESYLTVTTGPNLTDKILRRIR